MSRRRERRTSATSIAAALSVAVLSILLASMREITTFGARTLSFDVPQDGIYSSEYDVRAVEAPSASSWKLRLIARILVSSPLGDILARRLLVKNGIGKLVELADAIQNDRPSGTGGSSAGDNGREYAVGNDPLVVPTGEEHRWHVSAAAREAEASAERLRAHAAAAERARDGEGKTSRGYNSIYDYNMAYRARTTTPVRVLDKLLEFIDRTDATLRCVEEVDADVAKAAAASSTKRWEEGKPLSVWDGIPVLIKSEVPVKGLRFTSGRQRKPDGSDVSNRDDIIVRRFRAAGAIVVGSTVMHEKGIQPTGYNPWYGGPNNPYDLERFPGGSSSGSAVAVATGMVPVAVGFDGGGSVRVPASWSGTVGLAAGYGRMPFDSGKQNVFTVTKAGVLTATVDDATEALMLLGQPLTEEEGGLKHPYSLPFGGTGPPPPHSRPRWSDRSGSDQPVVRIGVFKEWVSHRPSGRAAGNTGKDDAVYEAFTDTLDLLTKSAGDDSSSEAKEKKFEIVDFSIPHMHLQALTHGILITTMFSFAHLPELFHGSSRQTPSPNDDLQPATEIQLKLGTQVTALELMACYRIRNFALAMWRKVLTEKVDVILTPTTPMTALKRPYQSDEVGFTDTGTFIQIMRYIWPGNLVGLPGLAVPVGLDSEGMPLSVQVVCLHWHEADCLAVGKTIEQRWGEAGNKSRPPEERFVELLGE